MKTLLDSFVFPKTKNHPKFVLPNRVVRTGLAIALTNENSEPLPAMMDFYKRVAQSGAGMLTLEQCAVHDSGKAFFPQLGISDDKFIKYHVDLVKLFKNDQSARSSKFSCSARP